MTNPELPRDFTYEDGRETRMRPDRLRPGYECLLRFKNPDGGFFEHTVTVLRDLEEGPECDRLYVDIHCQTYDREVEFRFDKETGCITQQCGCEEQEIGYIVSLREPMEHVRIPDSTAALDRRRMEGPPPGPPLFIR